MAAASLIRWALSFSCPFLFLRSPFTLYSARAVALGSVGRRLNTTTRRTCGRCRSRPHPSPPPTRLGLKGAPHHPSTISLVAIAHVNAQFIVLLVCDNPLLLTMSQVLLAGYYGSARAGDRNIRRSYFLKIGGGLYFYIFPFFPACRPALPYGVATRGRLSEDGPLCPHITTRKGV